MTASAPIPDKTLRIPCSLMRGGTSRGLVFRRADLPAEEGLWDAVFLAALGSPDVRQLDGVGAGDSHTSKVAVVNPSQRPDADVDFLFGEVAITEARVDWAANSGNIISALGLFAVDEGWVTPSEPETLVRIHNLNSGKPIHLTVPVTKGRAAEDGDFSIDGVPGFGPRVDMVFPRPEGAVTGRLLPTGQARQTLAVPGLGEVAASLVDAGNPIVMVEGGTLGVPPQTPLAELNADAALLERVQALRGAAAVALGLVERPEQAWDFSAMVPFPVLAFAPADYARFDDPARRVTPEETDLCARVVSLGRFHKSINVTVSVAVTAAALVEGTLAHQLSGGAALSGNLRIGHPSGVVQTRGAVEAGAGDDGAPVISWVGLGRTARRIMDGEVLVQPHKLRWLLGQMVHPG